MQDRFYVQSDDPAYVGFCDTFPQALRLYANARDAGDIQVTVFDYHPAMTPTRAIKGTEMVIGGYVS